MEEESFRILEAEWPNKVEKIRLTCQHNCLFPFFLILERDCLVLLTGVAYSDHDAKGTPCCGDM